MFIIIILIISKIIILINIKNNNKFYNDNIVGITFWHGQKDVRWQLNKIK